MKKLIEKTTQWKWAKENPKRFYTYSMITLITLFFINIGIDMFSHKKAEETFLLVPLQESSYKINESKNLQKSKDKLRGEIVEELKGLKIKREHGLLTAADSLRIEFLYHQYQKINE